MAPRYAPTACCTNLTTNMTQRCMAKVLSLPGCALWCLTLKHTGTGDERFERKANMWQILPATRCQNYKQRITLSLMSSQNSKCSSVRNIFNMNALYLFFMEMTHFTKFDYIILTAIWKDILIKQVKNLDIYKEHLLLSFLNLSNNKKKIQTKK